MRLAVGLLTTIAVLFVSACDTPPPETPLKGAGRPAAIKKRGKLVIATRNAPTVWYIDRNGDPAGPEHDLAKAFAASLGVKADFRRFDSVAGMLDAVRAGRVDLAAGGLTLTSDREAQADFGPAYESVTQQVVCNADSGKPRNVDDLVGVRNLTLVSDSSYTQMLESLRKQHPGLHWNVVNDLGTEQLLRKVWKGEIDCTIADSNIARVNRRYYPDLLVMFNLTQPQKLAWPMPRGSDKLAAVVKHWLDDYRRTGKLHRVMERYYGFIVKFNYVDKAKLRERLDGRYNRYAEIFAQAAENTPFSPALLAAQAYQESRWNPNAVSPTGVRGIMMLTRSTARAMGVKNRLDPRHSIRGGARYLARMEDRLDDAIPLPDRNYFALAAYNVGFAHLRDAMHLTGERGKTRAAGKMYATSCRYWPKSGTTSI
ncbi:MAG: membrane-bound lytic murein transglycosylase MltF [Gammaproteobacteria bacterium]|jgi:membrane-bound lytic murein transglycosylase F